jgi:type IV secretory pathway ATPase VirB11/archaellum biosynthesis ATPase
MSEEKNGIQNEQPDEPSPEFVPSRAGRMVSLQGLVERIMEQFELEHGEGESKAVKESTTDVQRRSLIRDIAEYIFSVESVHLSPQEQARIMGMANAEVFGYGPLDSLFADERVSTISIEGSQKIAVRYGPAEELQPLAPLFENTPHLRRVIQRLLRHAGAELRPEYAILEAGLQIEGRRVSVSVASPPFVPELACDIRVHPKQLPSLEAWLGAGYLSAKAKTLLEAIIQSEHGLIIVGDTESGKSTLLSMLLQSVSGEGLVTVERTSELRLPAGAESLSPVWPKKDIERRSFGEQILAALEKTPKTLVLDEVRADEPEAIAPLLARDNPPRQIWSFRGADDANRIKVSLGMVARMSDSTQPEAMVYKLQSRLPFLALIKRRRGKLQLREIGEWQFPSNITGDFVYADYIPLMQMGLQEAELTGKRPRHSLNLPDAFWDKK